MKKLIAILLQVFIVLGCMAQLPVRTKTDRFWINDTLFVPWLSAHGVTPPIGGFIKFSDTLLTKKIMPRYEINNSLLLKVSYGDTLTSGKISTKKYVADGYVPFDPAKIYIKAAGDTLASFKNYLGNNFASFGIFTPLKYLAGNGGSNGTNNTMVGYHAGYNSTTASDNVFIGTLAGDLNTTAKKNVIIGSFGSRGVAASGIQNNVIIGYGNGAVTTGSSNTFIGSQAAQQNKAGIGNVVMGTIAGQYGNFSTSTIIGYQAGQGITNKGLSQSGIIKLGYSAGQSDTLSNKLYINNANSQSPLLGGDFTASKLTVGMNVVTMAGADSMLSVKNGINARGGKFTQNLEAKKVYISNIADTASSGNLQLMPKRWVLDRLALTSSNQLPKYVDSVTHDIKLESYCKCSSSYTRTTLKIINFNASDVQCSIDDLDGFKYNTGLGANMIISPYGDITGLKDGTFSGKIEAKTFQYSSQTPIASASTIYPSSILFHVTGFNTISTIDLTGLGTSFNGAISIIPDAVFSLNTAGNIAYSSTAIVGRVLIMTYENSSGKWYPSY